MLARKTPAPPLSEVESEGGAAEVARHLRQVVLFEDLLEQTDALENLSRIVLRRSYRPGERIVVEGQTGSEMFLLIGGEACVFKTTSEGELYKVAILQGAKHAFFGEGALLDTDPRSATIVAESECDCLVLERAAFESFGAAHPQWALPILVRIARAVMSRLRKSNNDLMLLYNALVEEIRGG